MQSPYHRCDSNPEPQTGDKYQGINGTAAGDGNELAANCVPFCKGSVRDRPNRSVGFDFFLIYVCEAKTSLEAYAIKKNSLNQL